MNQSYEDNSSVSQTSSTFPRHKMMYGRAHRAPCPQLSQIRYVSRTCLAPQGSKLRVVHLQQSVVVFDSKIQEKVTDDRLSRQSLLRHVASGVMAELSGRSGSSWVTCRILCGTQHQRLRLKIYHTSSPMKIGHPRRFEGARDFSAPSPSHGSDTRIPPV